MTDRGRQRHEEGKEQEMIGKEGEAASPHDKGRLTTSIDGSDKNHFFRGFIDNRIY